MTRRLLALATLALLPLAALPSRASFVASSTNAAGTFTAAADFNTVAVALNDPGTPRKGTVALSATASSDRGIAQVAFQHAPAGGATWTDACVDTVAPYTCDWSTAGHDGLRDLRAVARDAAGYERASLVAARRIDNTAPALTFTHATAVHGTAALAVGATDAGAGVATDGIVLEYRPSGGGAWVEICRRSASGSCAWDTSGLANGAYDLRASATDALGNAATPIVLASRQVDNTPPAPAVAAQPPPDSSGVVTMRIDVTDSGGSGIQQVVFQARQSGTGPWMDVCADTTAPYECSGDTAGFTIPGYGYVQVPDGLYDMRGVAYDGAGNAVPTPTVTFRIDNTRPTVAFTPPLLTGAVTLTASVTETGSGIDSVRIEASQDDGPWTTLCASASCAWNVPAADASWDLRVVARDRAGNEQTTLVANRPGGTRPAAQSVAGVNGGAAGTLDAGDQLVLGFSEAIAPGSVVAGWDGSGPRAITATVAHGAGGDTLSFGGAALGQVALGRDVTATGATFPATLTRSGAQLTVTLGTLASGSVATPATGAATLSWTPAAAATDLVGLPVTASPASGGETL